MSKISNILRKAAALSAAMLLLAACSTTSRIPADDILYTGVKKVAIARSDSAAVPSEDASPVRTTVYVSPNN